jgi:hypothetical protein
VVIGWIGNRIRSWCSIPKIKGPVPLWCSPPRRGRCWCRCGRGRRCGEERNNHRRWREQTEVRYGCGCGSTVRLKRITGPPVQSRVEAISNKNASPNRSNIPQSSGSLRTSRCMLRCMLLPRERCLFRGWRALRPFDRGRGGEKAGNDGRAMVEPEKGVQMPYVSTVVWLEHLT